jgi:hypothetical protein
MPQEVSVYPYHTSDKYTWAFVFRRKNGKPVLRSLRIRRFRQRIVLDMTKNQDWKGPDA